MTREDQRREDSRSKPNVPHFFRELIRNQVMVGLLWCHMYATLTKHLKKSLALRWNYKGLKITGIGFFSGRQI